ncbi:hypothetical protein LY76DRAFT_66098 [Colletotrichum caudatum]|nr:hypothetical protein LY76DRAFT_66098 [Colletotrichum caudatum]
MSISQRYAQSDDQHFLILSRLMIPRGRFNKNKTRRYDVDETGRGASPRRRPPMFERDPETRDPVFRQAAGRQRRYRATADPDIVSVRTERPETLHERGDGVGGSAPLCDVCRRVRRGAPRVKKASFSEAWGRVASDLTGMSDDWSPFLLLLLFFFFLPTSHVELSGLFDNEAVCANDAPGFAETLKRLVVDRSLFWSAIIHPPASPVIQSPCAVRIYLKKYLGLSY